MQSKSWTSAPLHHVPAISHSQGRQPCSQSCKEREQSRSLPSYLHQIPADVTQHGKDVLSGHHPWGKTPSSAQPWPLRHTQLPRISSGLRLQRLVSLLLTTCRPLGVCTPPPPNARFPQAASLQRSE